MQLKNSVKKKIQNDEFLEEDEIITEKKKLILIFCLTELK